MMSPSTALATVGDRRVLEVELVALAAPGAGADAAAGAAAHRCHRAGGVARRKRAGVDHRLRALGTARTVFDRLRGARENVERADAIEYVRCFRVFGGDRKIGAGARALRASPPTSTARDPARSDRCTSRISRSRATYRRQPPVCLPFWRRQQPDQQDGRFRKGQRSIYAVQFPAPLHPNRPV